MPKQADLYTRAGATISVDGRYRYKLWREWDGPMLAERHRFLGTDGAGNPWTEPMSLVFIMLNPSTADGNKDDPTIRRCVSFAKRYHFQRIDVVNLFAYRATNPKALLALNHNDDPVGVENQRHVQDLAFERGNRIVCAWGTHGHHLGQDQTMLGWLGDKKMYCLGRTGAGFPRHPLYVNGATKFEEFKP
jgi:hypothetical protein